MKIAFFYLNLYFAFTNLSYFVTLKSKANLVIGCLNLMACITILMEPKNEK